MQEGLKEKLIRLSEKQEKVHNIGLRTTIAILTILLIIWFFKKTMFIALSMLLVILVVIVFLLLDNILKTIKNNRNIVKQNNLLFVILSDDKIILKFANYLIGWPMIIQFFYNYIYIQKNSMPKAAIIGILVYTIFLVVLSLISTAISNFFKKRLKTSEPSV